MEKILFLDEKNHKCRFNALCVLRKGGSILEGKKYLIG